MITIRPHQRAALLAGRRRAFVERGVAFVRDHWPARFAHVGDGGSRAAVEHAIRRAGAYGLTTERDVIRYLNHMLALGYAFDDDPRFPWAREILTNPGILPAQKMDWLAARTSRELREAER